MSKQEATRLADALRALHDSKQPHPTGPHGQMMGEESWRIVASGNQLYALMEAHDLLRRWPDGEPVALVADVYQSRYTLEWNGRSMPEGTPLFAAPPAESERIAALEAENAALKVEMSWPIPCHIATTAYRFDGERQVHIPQLLLEFAEVPVGAPNTAQGWADRDSVAKLIADATTPADATARIAALEAALEQARVALEGLLRGCKRSTIQGLTGWHEKSIPSSEALDAGQDALRKIEEVQK